VFINGLLKYCNNTTEIKEINVRRKDGKKEKRRKGGRGGWKGTQSEHKDDRIQANVVSVHAIEAYRGAEV